MERKDGRKDVALSNPWLIVELFMALSVIIPVYNAAQYLEAWILQFLQITEMGDKWTEILHINLDGV